MPFPTAAPKGAPLAEMGLTPSRVSSPHRETTVGFPIAMSP
jgi:hypothetical protein